MKKYAILAALLPCTGAFAQLPTSDTSLALKPPTIAVKPQSTSTGQFQWSGGFVYDLKTNKFDAVVLNNVYPLTIHGKPTPFSFALFAGTTLDNQGKALAGALIVFQKTLFDQVSGTVGFGGGIQGQGGFRGVFEGSITVKF